MTKVRRISKNIAEPNLTKRRAFPEKRLLGLTSMESPTSPWAGPAFRSVVWIQEYTLQLERQVKGGTGFVELKQNKITLHHEGKTGEPEPMLPENQAPSRTPSRPLGYNHLLCSHGHFRHSCFLNLAWTLNSQPASSHNSAQPHWRLHLPNMP